MRYALTFTPDGEWGAADTIIFTYPNRLPDREEQLVGEVIKTYGDYDVETIIREKWWFVRNTDDTDVVARDEQEMMFSDIELHDYGSRGGVAFAGEKLSDFLRDSDLPEGATLAEINEELLNCGIRPITSQDIKVRGANYGEL